MTGLFYAHSGLRYLVLLAGLAAVVYFGWVVATRRAAGKPGRIVMAAFAGLLDLQIVLGIILVVSGVYYGALMGHIVMMLLAAAVVHAASVLGRRDDADASGAKLRLLGALVALVLIAGGVMAIGRSLFGTGSPSVVG